MNNITVTEKYALCMLKELKHFDHIELSIYLTTSMILESMLDGDLEIIDYNTKKGLFELSNKIKVKLNDREPINEYNKILYNIIKEIGKEEISFVKIIETICGFSAKKINMLIQSLKEKMLQDNLISIETKKSIFGQKEIININDDKFKEIITEIRTEFLEKGSLTDDLILLGALLNYNNFLKHIFIKYEKDILKKRVEEIKDTEVSQKVKIAKDLVEVINGSEAMLLIM